MPVVVTYDSEADALYVKLQPQIDLVASTREIDDERYVDYDDQGRVVGVEFLDASHGIDLAGIPERERVAEAIRSLPQLTPA